MKVLLKLAELIGLLAFMIGIGSVESDGIWMLIMGGIGIAGVLLMAACLKIEQRLG